LTAEIEIPLEKHPKIAEVAEVGAPDAALGERVRACIIYPLPRSAVMAKAQDSRKEEKKKPAQTPTRDPPCGGACGASCAGVRKRPRVHLHRRPPAQGDLHYRAQKKKDKV
jgi:hypothetical protein